MPDDALGQRDGASSGELRLDKVSKSFGNAVALRDVSLRVEAGSILSLLGPSGCGKTTLLRIVAGFLAPTRGRVSIDGEDVTALPPNRRRLGMVFQSYALFPHMTVAQNVAFGLEMQRLRSQEIEQRTAAALALVHMTGMETRYARELSGGQQQRVSLARAFVTRPRILLLDEPFGALDRLMREKMQIELKELQRRLGITFLFVTHDQEEALTLSDRVAIIRDGRIEQIGTPAEVFEQPANLFVAEFFGDLNSFPVRLVGSEAGMAVVESAQGQLVAPLRGDRQGPHLFAVRALDVMVAAVGSKPEHCTTLPARIEDIIYKGKSLLCRVRLRDGTKVLATASLADRDWLAVSTEVHIYWPVDRAAVFSLSTES